jgi:hypothetical protein
MIIRDGLQAQHQAQTKMVQVQHSWSRCHSQVM